VIGFGQNTCLLKISKFPITAGVTCLSLRIFWKKLKQNIFFCKFFKKINCFRFKTKRISFVRLSVPSFVTAVSLKPFQQFFWNFSWSRGHLAPKNVLKRIFFAQMEQKWIGFGQNTFLVKISKFPITAGVTCL
jgi:hypothetical protein